MSLTIDAIYDGEVFRPEGRLNLPTDVHYLITIDTSETPTALEQVDDTDSPSWRIYDEKLRSTLEPEHNGELVAIHVDTGDFEVARTSPRAWKALRKRHPAGQVDVIYVGQAAVHDPLYLRENGLLSPSSQWHV